MGGYEDMELNKGVWRVRYSGNGNLGSMGTERRWLRRGAELAKASGYSHFVVSEAGSLERTQDVVFGEGTGKIRSISQNEATFSYSAADTVKAKSYRREGIVTGASTCPATPSSTCYSVEHVLSTIVD